VLYKQDVQAFSKGKDDLQPLMRATASLQVALLPF